MILPMGFWGWLTGNTSPTGLAVASPWADSSHLEKVTLAHLFELDDTQVPLTREIAMSVPSMGKARNLIAPNIGGMPLLAHTKTGPRKKQPLICRQPDPEMPALTTFTWAVDEMMWYGHAWFYVLEQDLASGRALRARCLPSQRIDFINDEPVGFNGMKLGNRWIRVDGPHEGILNYGKGAIRKALAVEKAYGKAADMPVPAIDLHQTGGTPLNKEQRQDMIQSWVAARSGKNGAVGYTSKEIDARVMGQPAETLLIAARNAAAVDMARVATVPAWAVDANVEGSSLTYSNSVDRNRELLDYGFSGYMRALEARWSMDDILAAGTWAMFSPDAWLKGDLKTRAEGYSAAQAAGIHTPEESRAAESGIPIEG